MDELLALMDNEDVSSVEETEEAEKRETILSTVAVAATNNSKTQQSTEAAAVNRAHPDLPSRVNTISNEPQGRVDVSIDNKIGIRMLKRQMSSIDLMDLVCSHPYHSTASIAASSFASLNKLLVEPTSVISAATVCGKTNIVTVGIVFTNSGTRLSSNGRAFCIVTIGNLETGPVVSVFLFGEAYSKYCAKCPPGTVVALVAPTLLSPKENSSSFRDSTTVSLSVNDVRQLLPVAQARDYGVCKGTVSAKRPDGTWVSHGARCKHFVDVRKSLYCDQHRKQQNVKNGPINKSKGTFIKQQRMEANAKVVVVSKGPIVKNGMLTMNMPGGRTVVTHQASTTTDIEAEYAAFSQTNGRFVNAPKHINKTQAASSIQKPALTSRPNNRFARGSVTNQQQPRNAAVVASRPAATRTASQLRQVQPQPKSVPVIEDWLNPKSSSRPAEKKRTSLTTGKKRKVNRDSDGYDGSVAVPKPNKIFSAKAHIPRQSNPPNRNALTHAKVETIREQQRLVAERQKENSKNQGSTLRTRGKRVSPDQEALKDLLFGEKLSSADTERVLHAKSRFSEEADAEAYAKSRNRLNDLERREELKTRANKKKKQKVETESAIQKEWFCATCQKSYKKMPDICVRSSHKVEFKRNLRKADTAQEKRLQLDGKSTEDGGLKLGAGLEWDRRRFS